MNPQGRNGRGCLAPLAIGKACDLLVDTFISLSSVPQSTCSRRGDDLERRAKIGGSFAIAGAQVDLDNHVSKVVIRLVLHHFVGDSCTPKGRRCSKTNPRQVFVVVSCDWNPS
jgi:hypothetical protein